MWTFIRLVWTAGIFPSWFLMHYTIPKTNLAPDLIFCQKNCDKTKNRRHGNLDRPWFGDQLWQFLKVNVCNLKTLELIGRPLWTHNTRLTGMCSSRQIAALKKPWLAKKNGKTWQNDVGSWVLHGPFGAVFWCRYMPILILTNQGSTKNRTVLGLS